MVFQLKEGTAAANQEEVCEEQGGVLLTPCRCREPGQSKQTNA